MRKFGIKYSRLHPQSMEVRSAFISVRRPGQWRDVLDQWYAEDLPGRHPSVEVDETADCEVA
jgi:tRNA-dihydrouridine synthase B